MTRNFQKHRWELFKSLRKISKDFRRNLSPAALWPEDASDGQVLPSSVFRQTLSRSARHCSLQGLTQAPLFQDFERKALLELHAGSV